MKGHCFSFIMPWESIIKDLNQKVSAQDLAELPRDDECLSYLVRPHLKVAGKDFHQHLKQVHLRPFVLVLLLHELIDNGHPVYDASIPAAILKERVSEAVRQRYPETEERVPLEERKGSVPAKIRQILEAQGDPDDTSADVSMSLRKMVTFEKHATPGDGSRSLEQSLEEVRPRSFMLDKSPMACSDPASIEAGGFRKYGELHAETGNIFVNQWRTEYISQALPFVIPRCVSGPDFPGAKRYRRAQNQEYTAAVVSPTEFLRGFSRRVERQVTTNWSAVPIVRSVWYKYTVERAPFSIVSFKKRRATPLNSSTDKLIEAMQRLHTVLWNGFVGEGIRRMPIAGDTTKLPHASGLTDFERDLARKVAIVAGQMPGSPQIRLLMGHCHFGARICHGDCLFFTLSPNEQHSALVLKIMRSRRNDPLLQGTDAVDEDVRRLVGHSQPSHLQAENETASIELPCYEHRRIMAARDPRAVVDAYHVQTKMRLPALLGVRMCPKCPKCNDTPPMGWHTRKYHPCQDRFGSNMKAMGGACGGIGAFGGATEYQELTAPHFHGEAHVVCAYPGRPVERVVSSQACLVILPSDRAIKTPHTHTILNKQSSLTHKGETVPRIVPRIWY